MACPAVACGSPLNHGHLVVNIHFSTRLRGREALRAIGLPRCRRRLYTQLFGSTRTPSPRETPDMATPFLPAAARNPWTQVLLLLTAGPPPAPLVLPFPPRAPARK